MILILTIFLGLVLGSLVNAYVWREHTNSKKGKKASIITGRSMCPSCRHELAPKDLIPIFSWLLLKGKCRYCHKPISAQYPLVELVTTVLFVFSYYFYPTTLSGYGLIYYFFWLVFIVLLMAMSVYDIKWMIIPNNMVYMLLFFVIVLMLISTVIYPISSYFFLMGILSAMVGGGIFYVLYQVSNGKWIGGGDVRLGAVLGLLLGTPMLAFMMIFLASLLGTAYSVPMMIIGKNSKKTLIPFGPFLILATFILGLFGHSFISWLHARGLMG